MDTNLFLLLVTIIVAISSFLFGHVATKKSYKNYVEKNAPSVEEVIACFKDVDWMVHTFSCGGALMETVEGCKTFYCAPSIKSAIEKMNTLMDEYKD